MSQLICITGMDGAGKSTLVKELSRTLPSSVVAGIWDIMEGEIENVPFRSKKDIDDYLCELTSDSRVLFLAHALKYSVDKAVRSGKGIILLNAYYYKYFATELAMGANKTLIDSLISIFPVPDKILNLRLPVEEAAKRKKNFSRYETGLVKQPDISRFCDFQKKALAYWNLFDTRNWIELNALDSPGEIFNKSLNIIGR